MIYECILLLEGKDYYIIDNTNYQQIFCINYIITLIKCIFF